MKKKKNNKVKNKPTHIDSIPCRMNVFTVIKVYCKVYNYAALSCCSKWVGEGGGIKMESYTDLQLRCFNPHTQRMAGKGERGKKNTGVCVFVCVCAQIWFSKCWTKCSTDKSLFGSSCDWFLWTWRQTGVSGQWSRVWWLWWWWWWASRVAGLSIPPPPLMTVVMAVARGGSFTRCSWRASGILRRSPAASTRCTWTPPVVLCSAPSWEWCPEGQTHTHTHTQEAWEQLRPKVKAEVHTGAHSPFLSSVRTIQTFPSASPRWWPLVCRSCCPGWG